MTVVGGGSQVLASTRAAEMGLASGKVEPSHHLALLDVGELEWTKGAGGQELACSEMVGTR